MGGEMGTDSLNLKEKPSSAEGQLVTLLTEASRIVAADGAVRSNAGDDVQPPIKVEKGTNSFEYGCGLNHLGVIIDGNRRYAKNRGMGLEEAYALGADKVYEVVRHVFGETDVREVSIYAISYENLLRKSNEVDAMLNIQKQAFDDWAKDPFFEEKGVRVRFVGERNTLPAEFLGSCEALERITSGNKDRTLNILVAYAGKREISSAIRKMLRDAAPNESDVAGMDIEMLIAENLSVRKPVDLIIRTAGGHRLSGFLPWQSDYAEIIAIDKLWPEVEMEDIDRAMIRFCSSKTKHGL